MKASTNLTTLPAIIMTWKTAMASWLAKGRGALLLLDSTGRLATCATIIAVCCLNVRVRTVTDASKTPPFLITLPVSTMMWKTSMPT